MNTTSKVSKAEPFSLTPWLLAARPKTLPMSFVPVVVGGALAWNKGAVIHWMVLFFTWLSALCIQVATNYFDDALDSKRGVDAKKRLGPARLAQSESSSPQQVFNSALMLCGCAILFGIPLMAKGGWPLVALVLVSAWCAYGYTGGPFPIAFLGLSELMILLFFGEAITVASFYLQAGFVDPSVLLAGLQIGCLSAVLNAMNNLRDREEDAAMGKGTLAVRFGEKFARYENLFLILIPFFLNVLWWQAEYPLAAILPFFSLWLAIQLSLKVLSTEIGLALNRLFAQAGLLYLTFGVLLVIGILFST